MAFQVRWRDQYGEWRPRAWGCTGLDGDATFAGIARAASRRVTIRVS